jgi:release factor glutamine methyltransferase
MNGPTGIRDLVRSGEARLLSHGVPNARRNAEWIMCHVLQCTPLYLYVNSAKELPGARREDFWQRIERRAQREPLQHILETTEFMSLTFEVRPGVFVPRPETETLVESALRYLRERPLFEPLRILDLCCGSGVVGLSIARALPNAEVFAVDTNPLAVRLTRRNARHLGVEDRVRVARAEAVSFLEAEHAEWPSRYTAVVCNPPYISRDEIALLPPEVRDWDPEDALDGGPDGLHLYYMIAPHLPRRLVPGGAAFFEIGATQGEEVSDALRRAGLHNVGVLPDFAGRDRVVGAVSRERGTIGTARDGA